MRKLKIMMTILILFVLTSLTFGDVVSDYQNKRTYIGSTNTSLDPIYQLATLLNATAGTATASKAVILDANKAINTLWCSGGYLRLTEIANPPSDANDGVLYANTNNKVYYRGNSAWVDLTASASSAPGGSDTHLQYNDNGSFGGIATIIWDDTNLEFGDDQSLAFGTAGDWTINFDDSVDDQLLFLTANTACTETTDPMFEIIVGASPTANQQIFGIAKGTQASNTALFTVDAEGDAIVTGNLTVTGSFSPTTLYQTSIAAAASGNTALTVNAGLLGNGTITLGNSSTGNIILVRDTSCSSALGVTGAATFGGAVTLGDAATDNITITGDVVADIRLDDDTTDSPALQFIDAGENDWKILKVNGATGNLTCTSDAGTSDFQIVTGNLKVGAGTETLTLNGEDAYVTGTFEVDGATQLDGLATFTGGIASTGAVVNVNVSSNYATNINTGSSDGTVTIGGGSCAVAIASTGMDVSAAGAVSNVTTLSMSDDLTLADGKAIKGDITNAHTIKLQGYDTNPGGYSDLITITNGDPATISIGGNVGTVAINSTDWDIDATGIMTGIGAITADGLITGSLGATISGATTSLNANSNFATNINTGSSTSAVTIGGGSCTVEIASTAVDIGTTGAVSGVTTLGISSTLTLQNSETIKNDTDGEIELAANGGEDFSFNLLTSNTISLTTDSSADTWEWGVIDALTGIGSLAFDAAASTVTLTATGNDQDLTIAVAGTFDSSLKLASAGTGTDAIKISTSNATGCIDIDSADNMTVDVVGDKTDTVGGNLTFNVTGTTSFSDKNITNVGNIYCDNIISDASSDVMIAYRTVIKTIDVNGFDSTDDFHADANQANTTEQIINLGAIIPAYAEIVSAQIRCFETVSDGNSMSIDVGTSSGGDEILAAALPDTANDILTTAAAASPEVAATNAARSVYVNMTPGANWSTLKAGRWAAMITYLDYGAVYTQKNP